jgi:integrase
MSQNPARLAREKNPQPKPREVVPFTHAELEALTTELGPWGPLAIVGAETGLRPSELAGLEWRDINDTSLVVARTYVRGELKPYGKTKRARRRVPFTSRAREALSQMPRRIDTPAVFASPRSERLNVHNFRSREWVPALEAAGIPRMPSSKRRPIYGLRHTRATNALDKGVTLFELSRFMGTSIELIDQTYGHLAEGTETRVLALLETENTDRLGHETNRLGH